MFSFELDKVKTFIFTKSRNHQISKCYILARLFKSPYIETPYRQYTYIYITTHPPDKYFFKAGQECYIYILLLLLLLYNIIIIYITFFHNKKNYIYIYLYIYGLIYIWSILIDYGS